MPESASIPSAESKKAFEVPAGAVGVRIWNETASTIRFRESGACSDAGANMGTPLPPGDSEPSYYTHFFNKPLVRPVVFSAYQASGGPLTLGYEILKH